MYNSAIISKMFIKMGRFYIPDHNPEDPIGLEDFYRRMCILFIPWRVESEVGKHYAEDTFYATFMAFLEDLEEKSSDAHDDVLTCLAQFKDFRKERKAAKSKSDKLKVTPV